MLPMEGRQGKDGVSRASQCPGPRWPCSHHRREGSSGLWGTGESWKCPCFSLTVLHSILCVSIVNWDDKMINRPVAFYDPLWRGNEEQKAE